MNNILFQALAWHFYDVPKSILKAWKTFLYFSLNYFSVPVLIKTFLSPWRKYSDPYGHITEVWKNLEVFIFNMASRIIGAILRSVFILLGLISLVLVLLLGLLILAIWIILPILLIFGFLVGLNLLL